MLCILCLKPPIEPIDIFGESGVSRDIEGTISKHFWFKPCAEDSYANSICSPCWNALECFDKFYKDVETAHRFLQLNPNHSKENNKSQESTTMADDSGEYNSFLSTGIKIELNEDSNDQPLEFDQSDVLVDPLKTKEEPYEECEKMNYESESEIPISQLSKQFKEDQENKNLESSSSSKNSDFFRFKNTKSGEDVFHIKDGVWLANCYSEETTDKRISHEEFDKFIKLNFELSCDLCLKPMVNFTALQAHFQKEHDAGKAYVTCCDKKHFLRASLVDHILLHKLPNYFTCILCTKVLTGRKSLLEHQKTHNKKLVYQCPGCDKRFHRKINLDRHKDVHVDYSERTVKCSHCEKLFASKFSLKQHMYDAHKIGCANIVCELCGKVCRDQPAFRRHQFEHTNAEKEYFPCEICGTRLATKDGLRRHKKSQHPKDDKKYFCNYCGLQSSTAHALHRHVTYMHTEEPRYKCTLCVKVFKRALRLKPNQDDENCKFICSSCWMSVDAFHKFYEEIKEAHCSFQEIKPAVVEDVFPGAGTVSNDNNFSDNNMYLDEDIKIENYEATNFPIELECHVNPLDISVKSYEKEVDIKSDSESEMPLSQLSKQLHEKDKTVKKRHLPPVKRLEKKSRGSLASTESSKKIRQKDKTPRKTNPEEESKDTNEEKLHIHEGQWLATCYAEETYSKPISSEELDKYLKLNIELLCGVCQKPMEEFASLHPHFMKFHDKVKPFVSCCGRKLKYRAHIIDHSLVHKIPDYFKCDKCSKVWPSRRNLKEHLSIHNKNFIYHCDKCNKSFCSKPALERHHEVHFVERPFKCEECDKFYATEYRLKQHAYNMHQYKKICEQCGQVFREKETFVRHLLKHTNQPKPFFECKICGARLSSKKILQKHNKFQHLEDSIEQNCDMCGITVKNLQALKRHMNFVHKYQREHKCTMCDKAFKRALTLKPNEDDSGSNSICTICWTSLESFHRFYEDIKTAHCSHMEIKPANDEVEDVEVEPIPGECHLQEDYNGLLYKAIKVELKEETNNERIELDAFDENVKCPIEVELKYDEDEFDKDEDDIEDSDSEVPLSKLTKHHQTDKEIPDSSSSSKSTDHQKDTEDQKVHIQDGIWLATCFGEESSDKPISHKELDKFIKINFELTCEMCRIPMKDFSTLQKHFKDTHSTKTFVTCCDRKFALRSRLVDHILLHKLPAYFTCVVCSKLLSSRENLRKHMIVHDKKYDFQCNKCDKTFYRKQLLDRHMDTHILDKKFKCDICDKLFTSKFSLGQHIYGVHKGGYKKICEQCGKVSRDHEAFVRHQLIHTNQPKPFVECPKCGIKLVDKNGLRKHVQSQHPDETREHICTECGIITNTIFALRRHITFMHRKNRDHKCPVCEKAFKRALTLKPSEDDVDFNLICSLCWKSLQSFHKFYQEIEKTHRLLNKLSHAKEHNFEGESNDCDPDENDDILYQGIKIELNDESSLKPLDGVDPINENIECPLEFAVKSDQNELEADETELEDSDLEIPLSKLSEQLQHKEGSLKNNTTTVSVDKDKSIKEGEIHIHEGKWLATCFGEETITKPISHHELDKFIKLNTELTCEICRIPMSDFSNLQMHFKDTHSVKPFVTCCDKKFELRCRLVDHILLHKLPNYFTCVVCSKVLSCRLNLRKHMVVHDKKEAFQCDQCEKTFYRKEVFNRHVLDIHTLDRKFKCEECDKLFASKCSLNTHIYGVHKGRYKKICEQCGKVSCDQETFLRHQMKHSNKPQTYFECPKCSVKLSTKHGLRHHIRYQHSEDTREHVCNVCGNISTSEAALKRHVTFMHKYKRDFKCSLCEKAFKRALTLKVRILKFHLFRI